MSISIDPISAIRDYINNRREKKELEKLLNKHYQVQTDQETFLCKFVDFQKIGNNCVLTIETNEKQSKIPFANIKRMEEIVKEEYEFPRKLDELMSISASRLERRPSYLSWLLESSKPIRNSAIKWFDFEISQVKRQIEILVLLFPHQEGYQDWKEEASQISLGFKKAIEEFDKVLALVEKKEATKITDIYQKNALKPPIPIGKEKEEPPNILYAFIGIFGASQRLENIIAKVERTISSIQDTVTITKIQLLKEMEKSK